METISSAPTIAASTLSVSAYTTDSQGNIQNTIFTNLNTNNIGSSIGSVETIFTTTTASVPADGYILVKLTAPAGTTVTVNWGPSTPTNFQVIYAYS